VLFLFGLPLGRARMHFFSLKCEYRMLTRFLNCRTFSKKTVSNNWVFFNLFAKHFRTLSSIDCQTNTSLQCVRSSFTSMVNRRIGGRKGKYEIKMNHSLSQLIKKGTIRKM
jgi:hypothetical protein